MTLLKHCFLLVFLILSISGYGQDIRFNVFGGVQGGFTRYKQFKQFAANYNQVNNLSGRHALKPFIFNSGYHFGGDMFMDKIMLNFTIQHSQASTSAQLSDYKSREFKLKSVLTGCDFGIIAGEENGGIIPFFGIYFSDCVLNAEFKYRDGYRSIGSESILNGSYHGFNFGASAGLRFYAMPNKNNMLMLTLQWLGTGGTTSQLTDWDDNRNSNYIGIDWANYISSSSWNYTGKYLGAFYSMYQVRLSYGLSFGN